MRSAAQGGAARPSRQGAAIAAAPSLPPPKEGELSRNYGGRRSLQSCIYFNLLTYTVFYCFDFPPIRHTRCARTKKDLSEIKLMV